MTDTGSFSSLMALVDNHLSKTNIQGIRSEDHGLRIPTLSDIHSGTHSETLLSHSPGQRLPIPSLNSNVSSITNVLAEQVANMLKAKEKKQKEDEEKRKLEEEMKKITICENKKNNECVIDLMKALKQSIRNPPLPYHNEMESSCNSSMESLFKPKFYESDEDQMEAEVTSPEPVLPCNSNMSYMLNINVGSAKCSNFGKVLVSRQKSVAAPYLREKYACNIVKFDFKTKSPCDLIKDKLFRPYYMVQNENKSN